jgi:hypothetical protein
LKGLPKPITFEDVPWPIFPRPSRSDLSDLTSTKIKAFLWPSASFVTVSAVKRELLRWHDDRSLFSLVARADPSDLELIKEGVSRVNRILTALLSTDTIISPVHK